MRYGSIMIKNFADADTALVWSGRRSRKWPLPIQAAAFRKLRLLNRARVVGDLTLPPAKRRLPIRDDWHGLPPLRIDARWHVSFIWNKGAPSHVEIVDGGGRPRPAGKSDARRHPG
jgi:toxin HigB-1